MGWANCGEDGTGRPIGYAVEATCDHPGCEAPINRGLAHACGGMHGTGGNTWCEGYFCAEHRAHHIAENIGGPLGGAPVCENCYSFFCAMSDPICPECIGEGRTGLGGADGPCDTCGGSGWAPPEPPRFHTVQGAEMAPDLYAGDTCDQERPRWRCWSEGDMGDHDYLETVQLAAEHFPPGTRITIDVPCCPDCDEPLDCGPNPETGAVEYPSRCECGFDWKSWVADEYS